MISEKKIMAGIAGSITFIVIVWAGYQMLAPFSSNPNPAVSGAANKSMEGLSILVWGEDLASNVEFAILVIGAAIAIFMLIKKFMDDSSEVSLGV